MLRSSPTHRIQNTYGATASTKTLKQTRGPTSSTRRRAKRLDFSDSSSPNNWHHGCGCALVCPWLSLASSRPGINVMYHLRMPSHAPCKAMTLGQMFVNLPCCALHHHCLGEGDFPAISAPRGRPFLQLALSLFARWSNGWKTVRLLGRC